MNQQVSTTNIPLGIGYYTAPEAARLLHVLPRNVNRWLGGYSYRVAGKSRQLPPLWQPQLPRLDNHIHLGFRDLIELRFVQAFLSAGVNLRIVRACLNYAVEYIEDPRPFSTRRFQTDGRTIFLDTLHQLETDAPEVRELLDLKSRQYAIAAILERGFKDLDIEDDAVTRWRPLQGKSTIIIDPQRVFGQPIAADYGVPTIALADAVKAEGSAKRVSDLFEVPVSVIRDACKFEESLLAA